MDGHHIDAIARSDGTAQFPVGDGDEHAGHAPGSPFCPPFSGQDMSSPESDALLVRDVQAGDRAAVERFVRDNAGWMLAVARRYLGDHALAEDCVQESFLGAFAGLSRFEGRARLRRWLHCIVVNTVLMKLRAIRRRQEDPIDDFLAALESAAPRPGCSWSEGVATLETLEQREIAEVLTAAIARLPEPYRVVLMMRDVDDMDTADVARALGLSDANVKVRLHRARRALKKLVQPLLGTTETPSPAAHRVSVCRPAAPERLVDNPIDHRFRRRV